MLQNFFNKNKNSDDESVSNSSASKSKWLALVVFPVWVFVGFVAAQLILFAFFRLLVFIGIPLSSVNSVVLNSLQAALLYTLTLSIVIGVPFVVRKSKIDLKELGLNRLPTWNDIVMVPVGFIAYIVMSSLLILAVSKIFPGFNISQVQNTGFSKLTQHYEFVLAFITLVLIAPFAEELLFRGYLFGKLRKYIPIWTAVVVISMVFGAFHGAWNLAIDTFALSVILCLLRITTDSIWSSIMLHMLKNGIAFYILFIYPTFLSTLVR